MRSRPKHRNAGSPRTQACSLWPHLTDFLLNPRWPSETTVLQIVPVPIIPTALPVDEKGYTLPVCTDAVADDFYDLYLTDIPAMRLLGVKRFRMSLAWPRILPGGDGQVNQKGLDYYARVIQALLVAGIEPHITLYHWDLPQVNNLDPSVISRVISEEFSQAAQHQRTVLLTEFRSTYKK